MCCVLEQDTHTHSLTVPRSTQVNKWVPANCWANLTNCGGVTCDGLASCPGGVEILLAASCYRNRDKLRQLWANLGSRLHYPIYMYCQDKFYWLITNVTCMFKNIAVRLRSSSKSLTLVLKQHSISGVNSITYWSTACYNKVKQIWMKS